MNNTKANFNRAYRSILSFVFLFFVINPTFAGNYDDIFQGVSCENSNVTSRYVVELLEETPDSAYSWYLQFYKGIDGNAEILGMSLADLGPNDPLAIGNYYINNPDGSYGWNPCSYGVINEDGDDFFVVLIPNRFGTSDTTTFKNYFQDRSASAPSQNFAIRKIDRFGNDITKYEGLSTRIVSLTPEDLATTTNNVNFKLQVYISPEDLGQVIGIQMRFAYVDNNTYYSNWSQEYFAPLDNWENVFLNDVQATSTGILTFSYDRELEDGGYYVEASLKRSYFGLVTNPFSSVNEYRRNRFVVNYHTWLSSIQHNTVYYDWINGDRNSTTTATTTAEGFASYCVNWTTSSFYNCLTFLLIPDSSKISSGVRVVSESLIQRFPIGYFYEFYSIMATTSSSSIPILQGNLPFNWSNSSFKIDLNNSLDWILYSTSTIFKQEGITDERTFFEITNEYFKKVVYLLVFFYILGRFVSLFKLYNKNDI